MAKKEVNQTSDWYEYDWHYRGTEAVYCVNLSYDGREDDLYQILVTVTCRGGKRGLSNGAYAGYERLRDKLMKRTKMQYVGLIETHDAVNFFFYAENYEVSEIIDKIIRHIANKVSYDCRADSGHEFYKSILIPDTAKMFTEQNRLHLRVFEKNGDCMYALRKINYHMAFPSESARILFEEEARLSGFAIGEKSYIPEQDCPHGVEVIKMSKLVKADIDDATTRLITMAQKYGGRLDFWDCVLIPKRRRL